VESARRISLAWSPPPPTLAVARAVLLIRSRGFSRRLLRQSRLGIGFHPCLPTASVRDRDHVLRCTAQDKLYNVITDGKAELDDDSSRAGAPIKLPDSRRCIASGRQTPRASNVA